MNKTSQYIFFVPRLFAFRQLFNDLSFRIPLRAPVALEWKYRTGDWSVTSFVLSARPFVLIGPAPSPLSHSAYLVGRHTK